LQRGGHAPEVYKGQGRGKFLLNAPEILRGAGLWN
jgi:hypothetical protein